MLEFVDLGEQIADEEYEAISADLGIRLGEAQRAARAAGVPVLVVFEGWDAAGKGSAIGRLAQLLDPRGFKVLTIAAPIESERLRPWMWRYWQTLPAADQWAIYDHSWYDRVLGERVDAAVGERQWRQAFEDIREFERQLIQSGAVVVKIWLHIERREQKQRFKRLEANPATAWKVDREARRQHRKYAEWLAAAEEMLQATSSPQAPWTVVAATHKRFVRVQVFRAVLDAVERAIAARRQAAETKSSAMPALASNGDNPPAGQVSILDRVDLGKSIALNEYQARLDKLQHRLFELEHELYLARLPAVIVFEGWDAAGKGGVIRRLTGGLDPRGYAVVPVAAPTAEESARPYLWRFWRDLPKGGHLTIFDRSWYGRVLVERVEGFAPEADWRRAYREINEFERQMADFGTVLVKFWLHVDPDEQLRRFKAREETPSKRWKITADDWRNREKWDRYKLAVDDMFRHTSTSYAPWTVLEANDKHYARIKALETVAGALAAGLERS